MKINIEFLKGLCVELNKAKLYLFILEVIRMQIYDEYKYFERLVKINNKFFRNKKYNNVRLDSEKYLKLFDESLEKLYTITHNTNNLDIIILSILELTGRLLYFQPFYDGNSRTLKQFIRCHLADIGYKASFNNDDYIIPMLFEGERCTIDDVITFKEKVSLTKTKRLSKSK